MPTVLDFQRLRETLLPEWTKPENASVFDPAYRAPVRTLIKWLGLDDPQQVMAFGTPLEAGPMAGGAIEALGKRFPRFAEALKTYTHPGQPPFYSRLEESVQGLPKQVPAPKLLGVVQKGQASAEELAARGVPEFAAQYGNKPIPKEAIAAHLEANPVQLQVKNLGAGRIKSFDEWLTDQGISPEAKAEFGGSLRRSYEAFKTSEGQRAGGTKYAQYQLPGGTNYRETLITLPRKEGDLTAIDAELKALDRRHQWEGGTTETWARVEELQKQARSISGSAFRSSHFDEPNILVHTRSNERDLPGLGRGTFLEEVQSDWHQKGKASGYDTGHPTAFEVWLKSKESLDAPAKTQQFFDSLPHNFKAPFESEAARLRGGVPDAPFKETWPDLALKHHLVEAAHNPETNWLGFTSGETQAARYDLSKQINEIHYSGSNFKAYDHNGREVIAQTGVREEDLPDLIGKEAAKKLLEQPKQGTLRSLVGQDLKVGGEGMKYFYDTLLPKRLEKIVKPFGGTVERVEMPASYQRGGESFQSRTRTTPFWAIRLTPEMKRRILTEGVPLMTGVAAVGSAQREK